MPILVAAVVIVGLLCTLDLVLSVGVIRRLRGHTQLLSNMGALGGAPPTIGIGETVGEFTVRTTDGEALSAELLAGDTLVGFFSPHCKPCEEKMPRFVEFAQAISGRRDQVLAVVVGDAEEAATFVGELSPVARVVVEAQGDSLTTAFKVSAYPTILMIGANGDGRPTVKANQLNMDRLPAAV